MKRSALLLLALAGAAPLAACSDSDPLTSPVGTTRAALHQGVPATLPMRGAPGMDMLVLRLPSAPPGFVAEVEALGGRVVWARGSAVMVAGLDDGARALLLAHPAVAEVWRH